MSLRRVLLPMALVAVVAPSSPARGQDRMPPIPADKMTEAQKKIVAEAVPSGGELPTYLVPLLRSPETVLPVKALGDYAVRGKTVFSPKLREFVIIIALKHWKYTRPWAGHYQSALKAGLAEPVAKAIDQGQTPTGMAADEQLLYDFTTQLLKPQIVDVGTYGRMVDKFGEKGVIDTIALVGYYSILGMTFNTSLH